MKVSSGNFLVLKWFSWSCNYLSLSQASGTKFLAAPLHREGEPTKLQHYSSSTDELSPALFNLPECLHQCFLQQHLLLWLRICFPLPRGLLHFSAHVLLQLASATSSDEPLAAAGSALPSATRTCKRRRTCKYSRCGQPSNDAQHLISLCATKANSWCTLLQAKFSTRKSCRFGDLTRSLM